MMKCESAINELNTLETFPHSQLNPEAQPADLIT